MPEIDNFFEGQPFTRRLFEAARSMVRIIGPVEIKVTRSQIAFKRRGGFAWTWMPDRYLYKEAAPHVLNISLRRRDLSPRWKQVVEPQPRRFMHRLEMFSVDDLEEAITPLLAEACESAGLHSL